MKILKNSIIVSTYVLLAAAFFFGGYAWGNVSENDVVLVTPEPAKAIDAIAPDHNIYYLVLEDNSLNFYSISNGEKTLIAGEKISADIYPPDDIADLKNGVTFDNIEDAQALFENFVS